MEEDGQSSVLVATDENGKPGLVKAGLGRVCVLWGLVPVCVKRALGLIFDVLCLYAVWSFPAAFHGFFSYEHLADLGKLQSAFPGAQFLLSATLSPIPYFSLRFFCKVVMRTETPGELLCGYSTASKHAWLRSLGDHTCFVALLWFIFLGSNCVGAGACCLMGALLSHCAALLPWLSPLVGPLLPLLAYALVVMAMLSASFIPARKGSLEAGVDNWSGLRVIQRESLQLPQSKSSKLDL